jgi:ABC-type uncharacterized transport system permease subunit
MRQIYLSAEQIGSDIAIGTGIAIVNNWEIIVGNIILITLRIFAEWIIFKIRDNRAAPLKRG